DDAPVVGVGQWVEDGRQREGLDDNPAARALVARHSDHPEDRKHETDRESQQGRSQQTTGGEFAPAGAACDHGPAVVLLVVVPWCDCVPLSGRGALGRGRCALRRGHWTSSARTSASSARQDTVASSPTLSSDWPEVSISAVKSSVPTRT